MEYIAIVDDIQSFMNSYQYGNVFAKHGKYPNFYTIEFRLPHSVGAYLIYNGEQTGEGQRLEYAKKQASDLANSILKEIESVIDLEDSDIEIDNRSVTLFMVSDDFETNNIFKDLKLSKIVKENKFYTTINEFKKQIK